MAVAISSNELERTIAVLSSAGQTLQLTRLERITYRALLVSVDVAIASLFGCFLAVIFASLGGDWLWVLALVLGLVCVVSFLVGMVSLALNIPLLLKTFREDRRLKRLGLGSFSTSLWKESRRSRWISRLRSALLLGIGILILVLASKATIEARTPDDRIGLLIALPFYGITAGLLFGARYLRNQRERMDLASSAEQLRKALQDLQQREGPEVVSVPPELLEQSAIIETAQITKERKDAVLQSAVFRPNAYAIAFSRDAAKQGATLEVADRIELGDLVAELSTNGARLGSQADAIPDSKAIPDFKGATLPGSTESKNVEIDYVIDHAARRIQVNAVRHRGKASQASLNGASDA